MGFYQMGEKDRERFGAPEWLEFDLLDVTIDDVTELADRFGFNLWDWPEPFFGHIPIEAAGAADRGKDPEDFRVRPRWQMQAALWVALHAAGVLVDFEDVGKVALARVRYSATLPGKDPAGDGQEQEPPTGPSGTPSSSTSTPDSA